MCQLSETTSNSGVRMRKVGILALSALFISRAVAGALSSNDLSLLERDTWSFSAQKIETLNAVAPKVLEAKFLSILKAATGHIAAEALMEFRFTDLDGDGIAEALARIDYSGRGLTRDLSVLSRKSGKYYYQTIPAYGCGITLWQKEKQNLIVGSFPLFELTRADPLQTFPVLYAWTGSQCEDVSRENKNYYEAQYVPVLTNALCRCQQTDIPENEESRRRVMIEAIGLALATKKLNSMFADHLVATNEVKKLDRFIEAFPVDGNEDTMILKKFREVRERAR